MPDLRKYGSLDALTDARRSLTLGRPMSSNSGTAPAGSSLTVREEGLGVVLTPVTVIQVAVNKTAEVSPGVVSLDLSGDGVTVSGDTDSPVAEVKGLVFPDGIFTDLGGGAVYVNTLRVLSVAEPADGPRVFPVTEIRVPDGTLTDLGDGNIALSWASPSIAITAGDGLTGGGTLAANFTIDLGTPGTTTTTSTNGVSASSHTHAIDSTITPSVRTLTAGAGMTGGGDLSANRTFDVATADTSMTINADSIQVRLAATSGLQISTGLMIADSIAGAGLTISSKVVAVGQGSGLTVNADDVALAVPGVISFASDNSAAGATGTAPTATSGTAVSTSAVAASLAATAPSCSAGDGLLFIVVTKGNTVTVTTPDGWELEENSVQTNVTLNVYSRIARAADTGASFTASFSGSINAAAVILKLTAAIAGEFIDIDGSSTGSGTSVTIPSVTTEINNDLVLAITAWGSGNSCTPDGSITELVEKVSTDASNNVGVEVAYYTQATAGATGTKTNTLSGSAGHIGAQVAIRPAVSGGHQHHIGATARPGAGEIICADGGGGVLLKYLNVGTDEFGTTTGDVNATGAFRSGVEDVTRGYYLARGGAAGSTDGGQIELEMAADYDGTYDSWNIDVYEDDLRIFRQAASGTVFFTITAQGNVGIGHDPTAPSTMLEIEETETLTGAVTDGYAAGLTLDPGYTGAFTVTRHNYIDVQNVSTAASAVVTDAAVFRFDAAPGTHKAVDSGTTKSSPGTVSAWMIHNVAGTLYFTPMYTSKTS